MDAGRSVKYTYDPLARLSSAATTGSAAYPQWGLSWTYDRYGNRTAQSVTAGSGPSNAVNVSAATNRITDPGYSYDANGNMTNDGLNTLTYEAENRAVTSPSGGTDYLTVNSADYNAASERPKSLTGIACRETSATTRGCSSRACRTPRAPRHSSA